MQEMIQMLETDTFCFERLEPWLLRVVSPGA